MIEAVLFMIGLGGACASALSIASKVFYVWEDPRIAEVEGFMAGANCGGCGFAGCAAAAVAVAAFADSFALSLSGAAARAAAGSGLTCGASFGGGALADLSPAK